MRPESPYLLGGHCYGGILAFEIARQLVAAGQNVALLVLFETPTPGYPKIVRHWKKYLRQSADFVETTGSCAEKMRSFGSRCTHILVSGGRCSGESYRQRPGAFWCRHTCKQ